jgi:cytochrome P450
MREFDFGMMMLLLFQAGQVTVRNTIPLGLLTLLAHPAELARLRADRALMPTAIEEILRHTTIASMFRRTATIDTEIAGTPIEAGAKVVAVLASANMDEDVFPDPFRFDVGRTPNHHIAFGSGQHFCIGAHIARMEIRTMIELLLDHSLSLVGPVEYLGSPGLNGIRHLPISVG